MASGHICKVRSHQNIGDLPPGPSRIDALGNAWADHAAVRARKTDHHAFDALIQQAQTWHRDQYIQTRSILHYLADLNLEHAQLKLKVQTQVSTSISHDSTQDWGTLFRQRETYQAPAPLQILHPAFITACVWGICRSCAPILRLIKMASS